MDATRRSTTIKLLFHSGSPEALSITIAAQEGCDIDKVYGPVIAMLLSAPDVPSSDASKAQGGERDLTLAMPDAHHHVSVELAQPLIDYLSSSSSSSSSSLSSTRYTPEQERACYALALGWLCIPELAREIERAVLMRLQAGEATLDDVRRQFGRGFDRIEGMLMGLMGCADRLPDRLPKMRSELLRASAAFPALEIGRAHV